MEAASRRMVDEQEAASLTMPRNARSSVKSIPSTPGVHHGITLLPNNRLNGANQSGSVVQHPPPIEVLSTIESKAVNPQWAEMLSVYLRGAVARQVDDVRDILPIGRLLARGMSVHPCGLGSI